MDAITDALTDWIKGLLADSIINNLTDLFGSVNSRVADVAFQVGKSPQVWNPIVYGMIRTLSETVILPISGTILAIVMAVELLQMIAEKNNMHDFDTWLLFKWIFKSCCAVVIISNTWNIVMGVFDLGQYLVNSAAGTIGDTTLDISLVLSGFEATLTTMEVGQLLGIWFQSFLVGICTPILSICIFVIIYGRMIEIYLVTSVAPIPMAMMLSKEGGGMGQNYLRSLLALGFQGFLIMVCVAIYSVLVQSIPISVDISGAIWGCLGYTVLLCFTLFKTGSMAKSVFAAH